MVWEREGKGGRRRNLERAKFPFFQKIPPSFTAPPHMTPLPSDSVSLFEEKERETFDTFPFSPPSTARDLFSDLPLLFSQMHVQHMKTVFPRRKQRLHILLFPLHVKVFSPSFSKPDEVNKFAGGTEGRVDPKTWFSVLTLQRGHARNFMAQSKFRPLVHHTSSYYVRELSLSRKEEGGVGWGRQDPPRDIGRLEGCQGKRERRLFFNQGGGVACPARALLDPSSPGRFGTQS